MSLNSSLDVIQSLRKGEQSAFKSIYAEFKLSIYLYCRKHLETEDAEDVTAETFAQLWHSRRKMESKDHVKNFLYLLAYQKILAVRKKNKRKGIPLTGIEISYLPEETKYIEENELLVKLLATEIQHRADMLPEHCRRVFEYYMENKSAAEISEIMNIKPSTVYTFYANAKERIRTSLKKGGLELVEHY